MCIRDSHKDPRLLETAGVPLPGVEIRIVDEEGRVCPPGKMCIRDRS